MPDHVDRALACRSGRGDAYIDRIDPIIGTAWKIPLRCASRGRSARPDKTHYTALRISRGDVTPAPIGRFIKTERAIIHNDTLRRGARKIKRDTRWIDLRPVIRKGWICHPQGFPLVKGPGICSRSLPPVWIDGSIRRIADKQMQMRTGRVAGRATDTKHFAVWNKRATW